MLARTIQQAGKRDRRITLRRYDEGRSATGAPTRTARVVGDFWAEKVPESWPTDYEQAQQQRVGWSPVTWRILYVSIGLVEPTVKWDLLEGDRVYEILQVKEIGRREGLEPVTRARAEDQRAAS